MNKYKALEMVYANGIEMHYAVVGSGQPVILIHGNGEDHNLFETQIDQLTAAGYRVYAPDSRGHGANAPLTEYHYADMAEDVYQFICALDLDRPLYYGHSDGGIIGLLLEISHPGTVSGMAISGTNLSPAGLEKNFIDKYTAINEKTPDPLLTLMLTDPHIDPKELEQINIPVLVTAGSNDLILPEETRCIAEHLPQARLVIVEGADHGSYIVGSEIMGNLLLDFFGEIG